MTLTWETIYEGNVDKNICTKYLSFLIIFLYLY